jgi:uncharacterized membrane protein (DUF4010 family)
MEVNSTRAAKPIVTSVMPLAFIDGAQALGSALAVGLLVGLERGWRDRELPEGGRVAGLRTFSLIGLLGGLLALLAQGAPWLPSVGLAAVALLFAVSWRHAAKAAGTLSITTAIAALATFALGMLASLGHPLVAVGGAVVVAFLLDLKPVLHRWLRLIQPEELGAFLQLGVLTAVVLPLLPDRAFGPYDALNPFRLWLAVILIAALSLLGHAAVRLRGERQGLLWAGVLGGLASSTAATLTLARAARAHAPVAVAASAAIVASCGVMFVRMGVVVALLQPSLALRFGGFLALLGGVSFAAAAWLWRRQPPPDMQVHTDTRVFDLPTAVGFGLFLGAIAILARAAREGLGDVGLYGVAVLSGLADVDALVISAVQMQSQSEIGTAVTAIAILLAAAANMVTKAAMAWAIAGRAVGLRVTAGYLAAVAAGAVIAWLMRL